MKSGTRAVGIAESTADESEQSTLAGAIVRADRVVDGLAFGSCTLGGMDATEAVIDLIERLERPDIRYILLGAIAPAWYNVLDLRAIARTLERPVIAVTFEASAGLEAGLQAAFSGEELSMRLAAYESLPPREPLTVNGETVFVRSVGLEDEWTQTVVRGFTPEGGRPEPIRVARMAARAGDRYRLREG